MQASSLHQFDFLLLKLDMIWHSVPLPHLVHLLAQDIGTCMDIMLLFPVTLIVLQLVQCASAGHCSNLIQGWCHA